MYYQLHLRRGAGGGAPLRTHTVHGRPLVVGIVAGSRTRSDGLGRTSGDEDERAEPVETPAGLREPRMVWGLRWPRMAADLPQTAGWTSRRRRRRFPANGEQGRAAGGGGPLPREQNQETKTFKNGRKTKPGGSGAEVTVF